MNALEKLQNLNDEIASYEEKIKACEEQLNSLKKNIEEKKEAAESLNKDIEYKIDLTKIAKIEPKELLNKQELFILNGLNFAKILPKYFYVCAQVPLKAFINDQQEPKEEPRDDPKYSKIYNKYKELYVDFVLISKKDAKPYAVLEFHGGSHYGKDSATKLRVENNDRFKEAICHRLGILYKVIKIENIIQNKDSGRIDSKRLGDEICALEAEIQQDLKE